MQLYVLVLALLSLPALLLAQQACAAGATNDTGCAICATSAADSDCNYCRDGYWKSGAKACTACPTGTGRLNPNSTVQVESSAICIVKSAPQLNCAIANSTLACSACPAGTYLEYGLIHDTYQAVGCSKDCKSFATSSPFLPVNMVPATDTPAPTQCALCTSYCAKCDFAPTLRKCDREDCKTGDKKTTACTECRAGYYILANKDTTVVPTCDACGANCRTCKDKTECISCFAGWAMDGTDKSGCFKSAPSASASIFQIALFSVLALFVAW